VYSTAPDRSILRVAESVEIGFWRAELQSLIPKNTKAEPSGSAFFLSRESEIIYSIFFPPADPPKFHPAYFQFQEIEHQGLALMLRIEPFT
jgi:hypothetical protein